LASSRRRPERGEPTTLALFDGRRHKVRKGTRASEMKSTNFKFAQYKRLPKICLNTYPPRSDASTAGGDNLRPAAGSPAACRECRHNEPGRGDAVSAREQCRGQRHHQPTAPSAIGAVCAATSGIRAPVPVEGGTRSSFRALLSAIEYVMSSGTPCKCVSSGSWKPSG
jgi:hypothetical protein